jgi:hypothetical protein
VSQVDSDILIHVDSSRANGRESHFSLPSQHDQLVTFCRSRAIAQSNSTSSGFIVYCTSSCSPLSIPQLLASHGK